MSWTTAQDDLRIRLSDGPTDKLRAFKRVIGRIDGVNTRFKTFEFRRVTDFTTATLPRAVYLNEVPIAIGSIASDDLGTGYFTLSAPPVDGSVLEATYFIQWFNTSETEMFLRISSNWLGFGDIYANLEEGLRPAALNYACGEAYQKLALRWSEHLSETYRLEDAQDPKNMTLVDAYIKSAQAYKKDAATMRDDFYKRQGRSLAPLFRSLPGTVRDVPPRR